jgi:hypothetical protein
MLCMAEAKRARDKNLEKRCILPKARFQNKKIKHGVESANV